MAVFVTSWKCVWVINNTSRSSFNLNRYLHLLAALLTWDVGQDRAGIQSPQWVLNLKIKPKKSFFFQSSVLFLVHVLLKDGILPNPEKVNKVKDWPTPKVSKRGPFIFGIGFISSQVYTAICEMGQPTTRSDFIQLRWRRRTCVTIKIPYTAIKSATIHVDFWTSRSHLIS